MAFRTRTYYSLTLLIGVISAFFIMETTVATSQIIDLQSCNNFAVLGASAVTAVPPVTSITGNIGLSPATGANYSGILSTDIIGIIYDVDGAGPVGSVMDPSRLTTAQNDLTAAYNTAAGLAPNVTYIVPTDLGGMNLPPGVYQFTATSAAITGNLTLSGSASDVWVFQIGSTLVTAGASQVILSGGALASNVYWQVGSSATIGASSIFKGNVMALVSISTGSSAAVEGRLLARTGAVTLGSGGAITNPALIPIPTLGEWGLITMGIMFASFGAWFTFKH